MVKKARAAGQFLGGIFNNPGLVILGLVLGGLFIFRNRISEAFAAIPGAVAGGIGDINVNLPSINLPEITLPSLPSFDFLGLFAPKPPVDVSGQPFQQDGAPGMFGQGTTFDETTGIIEGTTPPTVDLGVSPGQLDPFGEISVNQLRSQVFTTLTTQGGLTAAQAFAELRDVETIQGLSTVLDRFNFPMQPPLTQEIQDPFQALFGFDDTVLNLIGTGQEFTGGGVGFQGGAINPTPITTLTQVIDLFPGITASQAADFLSEFSGILPEAALLQGGDVINISTAPGDPPQVFNQTSIPGLSGTPEQIFKFLFPNLISNF